MLRGDEVGWLLGWWLHERGAGGPYANSIVSSSLLSKMAATYGVEHQETLTGFKWIGRIPGLAFGYEEALGYCVDSAHVADKDGVSAALLVVADLDHSYLLSGSGELIEPDDGILEIGRAHV